MMVNIQLSYICVWQLFSLHPFQLLDRSWIENGDPKFFFSSFEFDKSCMWFSALIAHYTTPLIHLFFGFLHVKISIWIKSLHTVISGSSRSACLFPINAGPVNTPHVTVRVVKTRAIKGSYNQRCPVIGFQVMADLQRFVLNINSHLIHGQQSNKATML